MVVLGVVLGLIGAGGSILVVPILVYLLGIQPTEATGYSLVIVGISALFGSIEYLRRKQSNPRMAVIFGIPAILGVYLARRYFFPAVPDPVFTTAGYVLSKNVMVMIVFAVFMLAAALSMIRSKPPSAPGVQESEKTMNLGLITTIGFFVGIFTGFVGAGGGFMILPVLVLFGGLPMKIAIGTDLLIIAAKSLLGFIGEMQVAEALDFRFIGLIIILPLLGIAIGTYLNHKISADKLKTSFGWFVLAMGIYIVTRELFF
jgi:uncharacterized membrane protein YfcA